MNSTVFRFRTRCVAASAALMLAAGLAALPSTAAAGALDLISNRDAVGALRMALEQGAGSAISKLGQSGGFLNNPSVRIPLPKSLKKTEKMLKWLGKGDELERLQLSMNHAAELAIPKATELVMASVRSLSVADAKQILTGGDSSVTEYFKSRTAEPLRAEFLPVVATEVSKLNIANQYNALAGKGAELGLVKGDASSIESYVTGRALDGLYAMIASEEKAIRANPLKAGSSLLKKVFGALR